MTEEQPRPPRTVSFSTFAVVAVACVGFATINTLLIRQNHVAIDLAQKMRMSGWCEGYDVAAAMAKIGARELRIKTGAALDSINPDNHSDTHGLGLAMLLRFVD